MSCASPRTWCYRRVDLDTTALTLRPEEPVGFLGCPRSLPEGFERFTAATGQHFVDHLGAFIDPASPGAGRVQLNAFTLSQDYHLLYRDKSQLLAQGPFGSVCALTTFFYDKRYAGQPTDFEVRSVAGRAKGAQCEPSTEVSARPAEARLDGISLVRVLRHGAGYLVVSANYRPDGGLSMVHVFGAKDGAWVDLPPDYSRREGTLGFSWTALSAQPGKFWLPDTFPVLTFLRSRQVALDPTPYPAVQAIVHLHYARNRWAEQYVVEGDDRGTRRILQFAETREDRLLAPIDDRRAFGGDPHSIPR